MDKNPPEISLPSVARVLKRLQQHPPFFVFYMARIHRKKGTGKIRRPRKAHRPTRPIRPSFQELAEESGIPERTLRRIASQLTWDEVKIKYIEPFCRACRVDVFNQTALKQYVHNTMKSGNMFSHLNAPQLKQFNLLCARWERLMDEKATSALAEPLLQKQSS